MTDYISREAALNFEMEIEASPEDIAALSHGMALMSEYIKWLPAADVVEQKHGKWIPHPNKESREWDVCTVCRIGSKRREYGTNPNGTEYVKEFGWPFCPNCGARMDGDA